MAKSKESWNKKEAEKKRAKKKKDKEQKKIERRANAKESGGLDDMIAYVDENGQIVSEPPDPKNKRQIKEEDIQISTPKQAPPDPADLIRHGTVSYLNESKGFGFVIDKQTQERIFVFLGNLSESIQENDKVVFEVERGKKGLSAVNLKKER
jgi:cold shock CspA family protein